MKKLLVVMLFSSVLVSADAAYSGRIVHVVGQLRALDEETPALGGSAIGEAGSPHDFFLLIPFFSQIASDDDLRAMLKDKSAVVRLMGVQCILQAEWRSIEKAEVDGLLSDHTELLVGLGGCLLQKMTVAELVRELKRTRGYSTRSKKSRTSR